MKDFSIDELISSRSKDAADMLKRYSKSLTEANKIIKEAVDLINSDKELSNIEFSSLDNEINELIEWVDNYKTFKKLCEAYSDSVDSEFFSDQEDALEDLGQIRIEDITVDNNLGIQEYGVTDIGSAYVQDKPQLGFQDLLTYDGVSDLMKKQFEAYKENAQKNNEEYTDEYSKYLKGIIEGGNITYEKGWKKWLSLGLDVVPVVGDIKGLIEAGIGHDLVTGRKLSDIERGLSALSAIPLVGDGALLVKTGTKYGAKEFLKVSGKELLRNTAAMGTGYISMEAAEKMGLPPWIGLLAYQGARIGHMGVSKYGGTVSARLKGVKSGTLLDTLRLENPKAYKNVMGNFEDLTKSKSQFAGTFGAGEFQKVLDSNKNLTETVQKLNKLGLENGEATKITNFLKNGDEEAITKFTKAVAKDNANKEELLSIANGYLGKSKIDNSLKNGNVNSIEVGNAKKGQSNNNINEKLEKIDNSNKEISSIKQDVGDVSVKANGKEKINNNINKVENVMEATDGKSIAKKDMEGVNKDLSNISENKKLKLDEKEKVLDGDPINVTTGSFDLVAVDLVMEDRAFDIDIKRVYDTRDKSIGVFGRGWSFEYESHIEIKNQNEVIVVYPQGDIKNFIKVDGVWKNESRKDDSEVLTQTEDNGFILNVRNKKNYEYNNEGKLIYISDRNNNKVDLSYDDEGNLSKITSPGGKSYIFKFTLGKIVEITDNIGRKITYTYKGENLVKVVLPNQGVTTYKYENNLINSIIDQEGTCYVKNEYDELGRVEKQYDKEGNITEIQYNDEAKENTFIFHATGVQTKYRYNERKVVTERVYMDGTSESYAFDEYNNKISETDRNGNTIYRKYDKNGNLLEETAPNGYKITNHYDEDNNLIRKETSEGEEILFSYDNRGNLLEEAIKLNNETYAKTTFIYDEFGRLLSKTDAENSTISYEYKYDHLSKPTRMIDAEGNIFNYEFDEAGRMLSINTTYGTVKFAYNELNKRTHITDAKGNTRRLIYDKMGNLKKEILPNFYNSSNDNGTGYEYGYDAFDRLIESIDPMENIKAVKYDVHGNLIKTINSNYYDKNSKDGIGIEHKYDDSNNKIKDIYPTEEESRIKYDPAGNIIKVIDAVRYNKELDDGQGMEYTYDEMNRLTHIKDPEGNILSNFIYNKTGNLIEEIKTKGCRNEDNHEISYKILYKYNLAGWLLEKREAVEEESGEILYNVTLFNYDKLGRKIEEKKSSEYVNETSYPENWNTIKYEYDKNSRIVKVTDTLGAEIEYEYDCLSNKTLEKAKISEGTYKITKYHYDSIGRLERAVELLDEEDFVGENALDGKVEAETKYEYDANGNVIEVTSPEGYATHLYYDKADRLIQITEGAKKEGQAARVTLFKYDKEGNIIKETDCNGNSTTYEYDNMNRMTKVIDKEGGITKLYYDGAGNLIKQVNAENHEENKGETYSYDCMNRLVEITNALGVIVKKNKYNIQGELVEEIDALNLGTEYKYNIAGRVKEVLTPKTKKLGRTSQSYTYDALGNITGIKDGEGNETTYKLDLWGRVTEINKADGSKEWYSYNYAGNITSSTDGNGNKIEYTYNSLNLLSQIKDQAGKNEFFKYDRQGRMAKHINRNQNVIEYIYNRDNNLLRRRDAKTGFFEEYSYNVDGSLMAAASGDNVYSYEYTPNGNLKNKNINGKTVLKYSYNKDNKIIELKDITGRSTNYKYDTIGRVEEVLADNQRAAAYSYNPDGTISNIKYGNGINIAYTYDEDKNITAIFGKNNKDQDVINDYYKYDNNGNQIEKQENEKATHYFYDRLQRLERAYYPENTETFKYDKAGNRIKRITDGSVTSYEYDNRNRLLSKDGYRDSSRYFYDEQGNLVREIDNGYKLEYTYDCFNRAESVQKSDGSYIKNSYNPEGSRSEVDENGVISKFIFSGRNVVSELDEEDNLKNSIIRGHGIISQRDSSDNSYYYVNNDHGDVTKLTHANGSIVNSYRYDAFGNSLQSDEQVHNRFRYSGEQYDDVTNQYYLRARFYNPVVGRFTQEDTFRGDGLNLYAYVGNNPVNYVDPSGYCGEVKGNPFGDSKNPIVDRLLPFLNKGSNPYDLLKERGIITTLDDLDRKVLDSGNWRMQLGNTRAEMLKQKYSHLSPTQRSARLQELAEDNAYNKLLQMEQNTPKAHFVEKHGAQTTLQSQLDRVKNATNPTTGQVETYPNGKLKKPSSATKFISHRAQLNMIERAQQILKNTQDLDIAQEKIVFKDIIGEGYKKGTLNYGKSYSGQVFFNRNQEPITAFPIWGE